MKHKIGKVTFSEMPNIPRHYTVTIDGREEPSAIAVAQRWTGKHPSFDKKDPNAIWALHEYEDDARKGPLIDRYKSPQEIERFLT